MRITVELMLHHGFPMCMLWGPERITLYNDAYRRLLGDKHPALFGQPLYALWPEIREHNEEILAPAWACETITLRDAPYRIVGEPSHGSAWFDATIIPVCPAGGHADGVVITSIETTERVLAQRRLRASEERYRAFVNASTDAVYRMSADWSEMRQLDGRGFIVDLQQTRADWMERYIVAEDHDKVRRAIDRAIRTRSPFELEHRVVRVDGSEGWTLSRAMPILDEDGGIVEWLGAARDITDRRRAENALKESEQRHRALFESSDEGMCIIEVLAADAGTPVDYRFLQVNPAFEQQTGLSDVEGRTIRELVPDHEQHWFDTYARIADTGEAARFEYEAAALDRWFDVHAFRIDAPELRRVAILFRDVLPRRRAEMALRQSEARLQRVLETEAVAVLFFRTDGVLVDANDVFLRMTGYTREQVQAHALTWEGMTPPEFHAESCAQMAVFEKTGRIGPYEKPYLRSDGSRIWMLFAGRDLGDGTIVEFGVNIDDRLRAEAALRESEERMALDLADIQALQAAGAAIIDDPREDDAVDAILASARKIMRSDAATLQRFDEAAGELELLGHTGLHPESAAFWSRVTPDGGSTCGQALRVHDRVVVEDIARDDIVHASEDFKYYQRSGIVAMQTTPLVSRSGHLLGMMSTHWTHCHAPGERELAHFDVLARQAADLIERRQAETARRWIEDRMRQFGEASQDVLWIRNAENFQWEYLTPAFETIYGLDRATALRGDNMASWSELIIPEDRARAVENIRRVRDGEWVTFEYRIRRPSDGEVRWLRNTDFPIRDEDGRVAHIGGIGHDITTLKHTEEALAAAEHQQRVLVEGIPQQVWRATPDGRWTWASPQWLHYTGLSQDESHDWGWLHPLHPDDRDAARARWSRAWDEGSFDMDYRILQASSGCYRWFHTRATAVRDEGGAVREWLGTSTDVHDMRRLQERQEVLVAELQHRTRNLMTLILALAQKTGRASTDLDDFRERFTDRLNALARVQGLLSRLHDHDRVTFDELIHSQLGAVEADMDHVTLRGPSGVRLRSTMVQTLSLALHELATNAVKYGALGQPGAKLDIAWSLQEQVDGERPWLDIEWRERHVSMPADAAPRGGGQGRELIERALPYQLGAKTSYRLGEDGVHCTISIPVSTRVPIEEHANE